jgi:hypothetical protein
MDKAESSQEKTLMTMGGGSGSSPLFPENVEMDLKGRNSKFPKKANHGARPCSSVMRKLKKTGWYKKITAY